MLNGILSIPTLKQATEYRGDPFNDQTGFFSTAAGLIHTHRIYSRFQAKNSVCMLLSIHSKLSSQKRVKKKVTCEDMIL